MLKLVQCFQVTVRIEGILSFILVPALTVRCEVCQGFDDSTMEKYPCECCNNTRIVLVADLSKLTALELAGYYRYERECQADNEAPWG